MKLLEESFLQNLKAIKNCKQIMRPKPLSLQKLKGIVFSLLAEAVLIAGAILKENKSITEEFVPEK